MSGLTKYPTGKVRNTGARPLVDFLAPTRPFKNPVRILRTANDNLPRPANDNVSRLVRYGSGGPKPPRMQVPRAMRLHPVVNAILLAWDLYTVTKIFEGGMVTPGDDNTYWAGKGWTYIKPGIHHKGKDGGGWALNNHLHPVLVRQFSPPAGYDTYTWLTAQAIDWYPTSDEYLFLGSSVWDTYDVWHKDSGVVAPATQPWKLGRVILPGKTGLDLVSQARLLNPVLSPVQTETPWPHPAPLPYRLLPMRVDTIFRQTGPKTAVQVATGGRGSRGTEIDTAALRRDRPHRFIRHHVDRHGRIIKDVRLGTSLKIPPKGKTKEKKDEVLGIERSSLLGRVIGETTEVVDYVDAIYDALPPVVRHKHYKKDMRAYEKAKLIYRYAHRIDINLAVQNLVLNEFEDFLFGKVGKMNAKASRRAGHFAGFSLGPVL